MRKFACLISLLFVISACSQSEDNYVVKLTDEERARSADILKRKSGNRFNYKKDVKKENGNIFLYLVEKGTKEKMEKSTMLASLSALLRTWSHPSESSESYLPVNDTYKIVIYESLKSTDNDILTNAIDASALTLWGKPPDEKTMDRLIEIGAKNPDLVVHFAVIQALGKVPSRYPKYDKIANALLHALNSKEPFVQAKALSASYQLSKEVDEAINGKFYNKVIELLESKSYVVRAFAAGWLFMNMRMGDKNLTGDKLHAMLDDEHPFPRSQGIRGILMAKRVSSIHKLMTMLSDNRECKGINKIEKGDGSYYYHNQSCLGAGTVNSGALVVVQSLSAHVKVKQFKLGEINSSNPEPDLKREVARAQKWYKANKAILPKG